MHTITRHRIWSTTARIVPSFALLVVASSFSSGQTPVAIQAFKRVSEEPSATLSPLPEVPSVGTVCRLDESLSDIPSVQNVTLKALPKAPEVAGVAPVSTAVVLQPLPPVQAEAPQPLAVISKVSLVTLPTPSPQVTELEAKMNRLANMDVDSLIHRPFDSIRLFGDLKTDRKYFESATMAEPTRVHTSESGPYLWNASQYCWHSATFCFSPLYFEQPNLERYGQGVGAPFASTVSAAKFVTDLSALPLSMVCTPPWRNSCTLGHHRPGDCAPYQRKTLNH